MSHYTKITITESIEVEHLNISLNRAEVEHVITLTENWIDADDGVYEDNELHNFVVELQEEALNWKWARR